MALTLGDFFPSAYTTGGTANGMVTCSFSDNMRAQLAELPLPRDAEQLLSEYMNTLAKKMCKRYQGTHRVIDDVRCTYDQLSRVALTFPWPDLLLQKVISKVDQSEYIRFRKVRSYLRDKLLEYIRPEGHVTYRLPLQMSARLIRSDTDSAHFDQTIFLSQRQARGHEQHMSCLADGTDDGPYEIFVSEYFSIESTCGFVVSSVVRSTFGHSDKLTWPAHVDITVKYVLDEKQKERLFKWVKRNVVEAAASYQPNVVSLSHVHPQVRMEYPWMDDLIDDGWGLRYSKRLEVVGDFEEVPTPRDDAAGEVGDDGEVDDYDE